MNGVVFIVSFVPLFFCLRAKRYKTKRPLAKRAFCLLKIHSCYLSSVIVPLNVYGFPA